MGKRHRDNTQARKKRGPAAFAKKAERRAVDPRKRKCLVCGWTSRVVKWEANAGICPHCSVPSGAENATRQC